MSEISKLIAEIKSEGLLRAGNKLCQLYNLAEQMEADYAALQQNLDALAVENAALKQVAMDYANLADSRLSEMTANCESDCRRECYELTNNMPANDAYLNSVRAEGVDMFGDFAGQQYQLHEGDKAQQKKWKSVVFLCCQYAEQLRSGNHDTAGKAG